MSTELSLELIKECLVMEEKELECIEMIIHPDTEAFLRREKENQDSNLQKLKQEKESIENFLESIGNEERAEAKLNKVVADAMIKEREYNTAKSNAEQAVISYEAGLQQGQAAQIKLQLATNEEWRALIGCDCSETLRSEKKELEQRLGKEKKRLDEKYGKTNKEQIKVKAEAEFNKHIALKTQAENELNLVKETYQKIQVYEARLGAVKQGFDDVENMIRQVEEMENTYGGGIIIEEESVINMPVQEEWSEL